KIGKDDLVKTKGLFILPSELFCNVCAKAKKDPKDLNMILQNTFKNIENSANGGESQHDIEGLFDDINVDAKCLGENGAQKNRRLAEILIGVESFPIGEINDSTIDVFGEAYEYIMRIIAADTGRTGGEFFTPPEVSELVARIAISSKTHIKNVYDPACGSGSLLLKFAKILGGKEIEDGFYGQEINSGTYDLCRMNMFLHQITFEKFYIECGDTLLNPNKEHEASQPFEAIVSNPPFSIRWDGDKNPLLINDYRFKSAGVLAPKSNADLAFVMHSLSWLAPNGTAAIIEFPGVLYRGGAEQKIRKYLIDNNFIDAIIQLPPNLFFGTSINAVIIVIKKNKINDTKVAFIDASNEFVHDKNKNSLSQENIEKIFKIYSERKNIEYVCALADQSEISQKDYDLNVSTYVKQKDTREKINIKELNASIKNIVEEQTRLRKEIDKIISELGD
ncbi:MAG: type I restriction-modification system subunit M, partial [Elusimicrobiota bacterium]|nr:type I restriction-modification system subunit M [Elusimicrobiota bacterium]